MFKRRRQQCPDHSAPGRSWEYYEFTGQYSHNDTVEVWRCIECYEKFKVEMKLWREHLAEQEREKIRKIIEWNDLVALRQFEEEKQKIKEEREIKKQKERDELTDKYVKKVLLAFVKYSDQMNIPHELLQLKRATIKLNRLIDGIKSGEILTKKQQDEANRRAEENKLQGVLLYCKKHGSLYLKDLIKGGKHNGSDDQRYKCRQCMSDKHRNYYQRNREYVLSKQAKRRKENPERVREINNKSRRKCNAKNKKYATVEGKSTCGIG